MKRPPLYELLERTGFRTFWSWLYRVELRNADRIPLEGPVILAANHESLIDPWLLGLVTPRPIRYMAKAELWRYPGLRWVMEHFGTFPVERGTGDGAAVSRAIELLGQGEVLGIFPQGTSKRLARRPYHRGAARLALAAGATLVPVRILGSRGFPPPGRHRVVVAVGEPIVVAAERPTVAVAKTLTERLE